MAQTLHGNARTTIKIREEIKESKDSIIKKAKKYNVNPKTIQKWMRREDVVDLKCGPKKIISSLSDEEQKIVCEFRRITRLSLDDCLVVLKEKIPSLTRSNLHRCWKRNDLSVLRNEEGEEKEKKKFKEYGPGFVHIDITIITLEKKKYYLFVAIDRCTKYAYYELYETMDIENSVKFLKTIFKIFPFQITKILTDNGAQFTYELLADHLKPKDKVHEFDKICKENNIEHRLTKFKHPWTNGQVEIMNKLIKNNTVKRFHYEDVDELKKHLMTFLLYYNHQKKLTALKYNSPYDFILKKYDEEPGIFKENPNLKLVGLNNYSQ